MVSATSSELSTTAEATWVTPEAISIVRQRAQMFGESPKDRLEPVVPSHSNMPITRAISLDIKATEQRFIEAVAHFSKRMHLSIQEEVLPEEESPSTQKTSEAITLLIISSLQLPRMHHLAFRNTVDHLHTQRELHGFHSELDAPSD